MQSVAHFQVRESTSKEGTLRLTLTGELDLVSAPVLKERLAALRAERMSVRLDLAQLEYVDSTGLCLLLTAMADARRDGWNLLVDPQIAPQARRLFELVQVKQYLVGDRATDGS